MIGNKLEYLLEYQRHNLILTKTLEHLSTERASNESLLIALKETPLAMTSKHHYYKQLSKLDAGRYNPDEPHIRMIQWISMEPNIASSTSITGFDVSVKACWINTLTEVFINIPDWYQ